MSETLSTIVHVSFGIGKSLPPFLTVAAVGTAGSGGWTNVRLSPYIYIEPPADGIQEFDLIGDPPSDAVITVITPYAAAYAEHCDDWVVGVRVHAASNSMEGNSC